MTEPMYYSRSQKMENAAFILALIAAASCTIFYISIVCGSLAILLALLSKGGKKSCTRRAISAIVIASIGILASIVINVMAIRVLLDTYGSWDGILRYYCEVSGIDYESLMY